MGIDNFCKLIEPIASPSAKPNKFDSVLIDCQTFLYSAIEKSLQVEEDKLFLEICTFIWNQLKDILNCFCRYTSNCITFILSFDGEGVPMKWATQKKRRERFKNESVSRRDFYRCILFGNNKLTHCVQNYVKEQCKLFENAIKVVLCGCNVPGEGEHKIFQLANVLENCKNPIVVSVDQDVFMLSFLRLDKFETIQIYRYNKFYSINEFAIEKLPYPLERLINISFLFGNDFIPTLIAITATNPPAIHRCLSLIDDDDPPTMIASFIKKMERYIRYTIVEFVDSNLVICFWMIYFWMLDYYTHRCFPQQFLENRLYEAFNRNQLLTGLSDINFSKEAFQKAEQNYKELKTQPIPNAEQHVFIDLTNLLNQLNSYWIKSNNHCCTVLRIPNKKHILRK